MDILKYCDHCQCMWSQIFRPFRSISYQFRDKSKFMSWKHIKQFNIKTEMIVKGIPFLRKVHIYVFAKFCFIIFNACDPKFVFRFAPSLTVSKILMCKVLIFWNFQKVLKFDVQFWNFWILWNLLTFWHFWV